MNIGAVNAERGLKHLRQYLKMIKRWYARSVAEKVLYGFFHHSLAVMVAGGPVILPSPPEVGPVEAVGFHETFKPR